MVKDASAIQQWHDDEKNWWNLYGEYMTYQWQLTPETSESIRGELERDYKSFLSEPGEHLLDLGCGSGWLSAYFAERGMLVTGIDVSHEQINAANELKARMGLENVSFQCSDFMTWDASQHRGMFSSVFVSAFLHHLPESELALIIKKIANVVKPGGRVYLYEPLQCESNPTFTIKVIDKVCNVSLHLLFSKFPNWFGWWCPRHIAELGRGYTMCSPHERPVPLGLLHKCCSDDFDINETRGWHLNSLGIAMQSMGLIEPIRRRYQHLAKLYYRFDQFLFRRFGWEAFSLPGRFILCSVKMVRK